MGGPQAPPVPLHLPQGAEQHGNARAVHEGDAGQIQGQAGGDALGDGLVQLGHHVPGGVVVDLAGQGNGEAAVLAGDGDGHGLSPLCEKNKRGTGWLPYRAHYNAPRWADFVEGITRNWKIYEA